MPRRHPRPFDYHRPNGDQIERIEKVRAAYQQCVEAVRQYTREGSVSGRYVSLSETALEESAMWATKSIVFEADNEETT